MLTPRLAKSLIDVVGWLLGSFGFDPKFNSSKSVTPSLSESVVSVKSVVAFDPPVALMVKNAAELPLPILPPEPIKRGALVVGSLKENYPTGPPPLPSSPSPYESSKTML